MKKVRKRKINIVFYHIYIESRKMVLKTYLQGSNGDADIENRFVETRGKERVGKMRKVA